jgi:hypothetical protein
MTAYLIDDLPSRFELTPTDVWVEIRGARGEFQWSRLTREEFIFRQSLSEGVSIGDAAERVLDANAEFHPGHALASIFTAGLVLAVRQKNQQQT